MKTPASCASHIHKKSISRSKNSTKKSSVRKLYEVFTPRERMQAVLLFSVALVTAFAQALGVFSIFPFINVVMNPESIQTNRWLSWGYTTMGFAKPGTFMIALGMATIATVVFSNALSALTMWGKARFVLNKNHTLSKRLLEVYLSKPYEFFLLKNTSELGKNVLAEINALTNNFLMPLFDGAINILLLLVIVGMLFAVDPLVTAGALLFLGATYGLLNFYTRTQLRKKGAQRLEANTKRFRAATEALSSIKITKVMGVEPYFLHQYAAHSGTFARLNVFARIIGQLPYYIMEAVVFGGLLLFVVISLHGGENVATIIPLVSLYAFAGKRMMPALQIIYLSVTQIYYNQAILDKVYQDMIEENLLGNPIPLSGEPVSEEGVAITFQRELSLKDISFAYADSGKNVIDSLSLAIPKGSVIGFVGATGSGKTTLVDILLGLLIPQSGSILVDGIPLNRENLHTWQRNIGYVPQEIYLSDDTLRKNIAFGVPDKDVDDDQVLLAARMAALDAFVNSLPQGYHTIIGERGVRLSGGQRQRIGLARALYRNPEVLVLDEATSALDGHTEERVLEAIRRASESRTVIMIAHRLNTLKDCDTIYMMEEGRFTASGTYDDLLRENRKFMDMAKVGSPV